MSAEVRTIRPRCPACGGRRVKVRWYEAHETIVIRYRTCHDCGLRWTTHAAREVVVAVDRARISLPAGKTLSTPGSRPPRVDA